METELGRDSFLEGLECLIGLQKAYCKYITTTSLKCYYNQKLTSIFFDISKVLMSNTYYAKFQVFMSTESAIN